MQQDQHVTELLYSRFLLANGVSIDTRTLVPGALFFALEGDTQDGHLFAQEALEKGASYVVTSKPPPAKDERYLCVPDVLEALQRLASFHRSTYRHPLIGITGSNGKTTTKSLLSCLLSAKYSVHFSQKSYNNHIGVPLTLLGILPQTEVAVIELGSNHPGEIAALCELSRPTHGLITSLGKAHLQGFGEMQGVLEEKKKLFDYLDKTGGTFFLNSRIRSLNMFKMSGGKMLRYPSADDDYTIRHLSDLASEDGLHFQLSSGEKGTVALFGGYHFDNLAAAIAVAQHLKVPKEAIIAALKDWKPVPQRCEWTRHKNKNLLLDLYNANPDSMAAVLRAFSVYPKARKGVILGDMLELGASAAREHLAIGKLLNTMPFDPILLCGIHMKIAADVVKRAQYFPTKAELCAYLRAHPIATDHNLLLKASRSLALETILEVL